MATKTRSRYQSDSGTIHAILLTAPVAAVAGTAPSGAVDSDIKAKVSKTNREYGIRPRLVVLAQTVGTGANSFTKYARIPVLTPTDFASGTFQLGASVAYNGGSWTVASRLGEDY